VRHIDSYERILPGDMSLADGKVRCIFADIKHLSDRSWSCMPLTNLLATAAGTTMQRWIYSDPGGSTWRP
jgi:hypothetical protein